VTLTNPRLLGGMFIGVHADVPVLCDDDERGGPRGVRDDGRVPPPVRQDAPGVPEHRDVRGADVADPDNWPKRGRGPRGHQYPDYANCVSISTAGAQREMVMPSILAIVVPMAVGLILSCPA
jgi:hypothetical protein